MTILELIQAECRGRGVNDKYAEKIQKIFKIEKEDGTIGSSVALFKENILPDLEATEAANKTAEEAAKKAAIEAYEKEHGLKGGKPIEIKKDDEVDLSKLSPELQAYFKTQQAAIAQLAETVSGIAKGVQVGAKTGTARELFTASKLPEKWFGRIDVNSETSVEDQIKALQAEYTEIQQSIINEQVESGAYKPNIEGTPKDRTAEEWAQLMDGEGDAAKDNGTVDLGLK